MTLTDALHKRTTLLKLSQRGGMEPKVTSARLHLLAENIEGTFLALPHLAHLLVEEAQDNDTQEIEVYGEIVEHAKKEKRLTQHGDGLAHAGERLLLAQEGGNVEHARPLALTHQGKAEGVHHVT